MLISVLNLLAFKFVHPWFVVTSLRNHYYVTVTRFEYFSIHCIGPCCSCDVNL